MLTSPKSSELFPAPFSLHLLALRSILAPRDAVWRHDVGLRAARKGPPRATAEPPKALLWPVCCVAALWPLRNRSPGGSEGGHVGPGGGGEDLRGRAGDLIGDLSHVGGEDTL